MLFVAASLRLSNIIDDHVSNSRAGSFTGMRY